MHNQPNNTPALLSDLVPLEIDQINVIPLDSNTGNQIRVIAYIAHQPFNLETYLPVDGFAINVASSFAIYGYNFGMLLGDKQVTWQAVSRNIPPSNNITQLLNFSHIGEQFIAPIEGEESNEIITKLVIEFRDRIDYMVNFGFKNDLLNSVFLGQNNQRIINEINSCDLNKFLTLKNIYKHPTIVIHDTKLQDHETVKLNLTITSHIPQTEDYVSINSIATFTVDHKAQQVKLKRVITSDLNCHVYDDEDLKHYTSSLEEWLENLHTSMDQHEIIDMGVANYCLERIISSNEVAKKVGNLLF